MEQSPLENLIVAKLVKIFLTL